MRLLQVSLRSSLIYTLVVVLISIPVSILSMRQMLLEDVDETLAMRSHQFSKHIQSFAYLDDLETDLTVLDKLSSDIDIKLGTNADFPERYSTVYVYDSAENESHRFRELSSGVPIKGKNYILTVRLSMLDNNELIIAIGAVQSVLIILLAGGLLFLNRSLSRKLWKPFYSTLQQLKAYQIDKNEVIHPEKTDISEFDDLNKTVAQLTDRNRKLFLDQKEFIENASHELQTPLAIFQAKLDVLMQNPSLSESDAGTVMELDASARRMARLNKDLLMLSKIDNEHFSATESVDVSDLTAALLANLTPMAATENITISSKLAALRIKANKTLIEVLLTNLLHNSVRHTESGGHVVIETTAKSFTIANTGSPLTMDPEKMFERFQKESKHPGSTGLGLAIVKRICETSGYRVQYRYARSTHIFSVNFSN